MTTDFISFTKIPSKNETARPDKDKITAFQKEDTHKYTFKSNRERIFTHSLG